MINRKVIKKIFLIVIYSFAFLMLFRSGDVVSWFGVVSQPMKGVLIVAFPVFLFSVGFSIEYTKKIFFDRIVIMILYSLAIISMYENPVIIEVLGLLGTDYESIISVFIPFSFFIVGLSLEKGGK